MAECGGSTLAPGTRLYETGATRDKNEDKLSYKGFLSPEVLKRYAEYMHECRKRNIPPGQALRAPDNWKKGIPVDDYADSLIRHVMEFWLQYNVGYVAEDTLCAIMFNVMGYLFETLKEE